MRKIAFHFFTIPEYEDEEKYLTKQHKKGWKFYRYILPGIYLFTRCEPENVVYRLDYNQEGLRERTEYFQMYHDCGWEHICDVMGYSYFRKLVSEENSADEIFNDAQSRLDMVERVYHGRIVPCLVIFFLIICPQLVLQFSLHNTLSNLCFGLYVFLFFMYLVMFIKFVYKRRKLQRLSE